MKSLDCDIIQDLLPSYSDKICSNATIKLVEEHLQQCNNCRKILNNMNKDVNIEIPNNQTEKINYLKGYKKRRKLLIILSIILTVMVLATIFAVNIANNNIMVDKPLYVDANEFNVEYMYIKENAGINETTGETFKFKTLEVYIYSEEFDKFKDRYLTGEYSVSSGEKDINYIITARKLPKGMEFDGSGLELSFRIEDIEDNINIERIYLRDTKNNSKEIWNKDMKVQTEEEWRKWYIDNYVPKEIKEKYNMSYENIPICTSIWKCQYNKELVK